MVPLLDPRGEPAGLGSEAVTRAELADILTNFKGIVLREVYHVIMARMVDLEARFKVALEVMGVSEDEPEDWGGGDG